MNILNRFRSVFGIILIISIVHIGISTGVCSMRRLISHIEHQLKVYNFGLESSIVKNEWQIVLLHSPLILNLLLINCIQNGCSSTDCNYLSIKYPRCSSKYSKAGSSMVSAYSSATLQLLWNIQFLVHTSLKYWWYFEHNLEFKLPSRYGRTELQSNGASLCTPTWPPIYLQPQQ